MMQADTIERLVNEHLQGTDIFLVDVRVKPGNFIQVELDKMEGISIDECVEVSRYLNGKLDRDEEDFSLEVSSPGLDTPYKTKRQYEKNIGREVEVVTLDGKMLKGTLLEAGKEGIVLQVLVKELAGGSQKKKKWVPEKKNIDFKEIKTTKTIISFK